MEKSFIVRADFYPNGEIIPLGITDSHGDTDFVQKSKEVFSSGNSMKCFECVTKRGQFFLKFKNGKWYVDNIKK